LGYRPRVTFPDHDQLQSYWLPVVVPKTQNDKAYWVPDIGEQVVCDMDEHDEAGAVLGAIYSSADVPPVQSADKWHLKIQDGAAFEYDRLTHAMTVSLPPGATLNVAANGATIAIDTSGNVIIDTDALVKLAGGGAAIARVGDSTSCPAGAGQITSGSSKVQSG
jgi:phage baseplate assembly protein V